jgi:hypothetical protein
MPHFKTFQPEQSTPAMATNFISTAESQFPMFILDSPLCFLNQKIVQDSYFSLSCECRRYVLGDFLATISLMRQSCTGTVCLDAWLELKDSPWRLGSTVLRFPMLLQAYSTCYNIKQINCESHDNHAQSLSCKIEPVLDEGIVYIPSTPCDCDCDGHWLWIDLTIGRVTSAPNS